MENLNYFYGSLGEHEAVDSLICDYSLIVSTDEWCLRLELITIQYMPQLKQRAFLPLLITHTCIAVNPELFGSISSEAREY